MNKHDKDNDLYALGSAQYFPIWQEYVRLSNDHQTIEFEKDQILQKLVSYINDIVGWIKEEKDDMIKAEPLNEDYKDWSAFNSMKFKIELVYVENPLSVKLGLMFLFEFLRKHSYDLWTVLGSITLGIPEIEEYLEPAEKDIDSNESMGSVIYFLKYYLDMSDKEVIETFGEFDT